MDSNELLLYSAGMAEKAAQVAWRAGNRQKAYAELNKAANLLSESVQRTSRPGLRQVRTAKVSRLRAKAEQIKSGQMVNEYAGSSAEPAGGEDPDDFTSRVRSLIEKTSVTWDEIAGLDEPKDQIRSLYGMALARWVGAAKRIRPTSNLLLYGPPGTGKTMLAAAASNQLDATFYNVTTGDLLSKWFGESPRIIQALYKDAAANSPSVIFIDEIDALVPDRESGSLSIADNRVVTQFLTELDGISGKDSDSFLMTIAATNRPWQLDGAILRRFGRFVYLPLPDRLVRNKILELNLLDFDLECSLDEIVDLTEGLSGSEISTMAQETVRLMIGRSNPGMNGIVDQGVTAIKAYEVQTSTITKVDFTTARKQIVPAVSCSEIKRYEQWRTNAS